MRFLFPSCLLLQAKCDYVNNGDFYSFEFTFSNSPNDGISLLYLPGNSSLPPGSLPNTTIPKGFGEGE